MKFSALGLLFPFGALGLACVGEEGAATRAEGAATHQVAQTDSANQHVAHLREKLSLTDEQAVKIEAVFREDIGMPTRMTKLRALLSDEQAIKFDDMIAKHHKGGKHSRSGEYRHGGASGHASILQERLGLTDDQSTKVQQVYASVMPRMREIREQISELEIAAEKDPSKLAIIEELRAEKAQLKQQKISSLGTILSADQLAEYQRIKSEHHDKGGHGCGGKSAGFGAHADCGAKADCARP